jgi:protein-disulfide isomerase
LTRTCRTLVAAGIAALCFSRGASFAQQAEPANAALVAKVRTFMERYLPYDPQSRVTIETSKRHVPPFLTFDIHRKGKYDKLDANPSVLVSRDGRYIYVGTVLQNRQPLTGRTLVESDLAGFQNYIGQLYQTTARIRLDPTLDTAGMRGVRLNLETGFGTLSLGGYVAPDLSSFLFSGSFWRLDADPRDERRERISLEGAPVSGPAEARVTIIEYADMACAHCRKRDRDMDKLLEKFGNRISVRRYYKFYPLWMVHPWSMKAASAGVCIERQRPADFFEFKNQVYDQQDTLTVGSIDDLAVQFAESKGYRGPFLNCYLRPESFGLVLANLAEGSSLGIDATPTIYVNGQEVSWIDDPVMQEYMDTLMGKKGKKREK